MTTPLGKRVLLVDDEVAVRNIYQLSLERLGVSVFSANGATEALRYFQVFPFDAVLVDIHLKDGDGVDLLGHIKKIRPETKTIGMTGYPCTPELKRSLRAANVDYFHSKLDPITKLSDYL
jgi:DNA-binding NtrC family response regulator